MPRPPFSPLLTPHPPPSRPTMVYQVHFKRGRMAYQSHPLAVSSIHSASWACLACHPHPRSPSLTPPSTPIGTPLLSMPLLRIAEEGEGGGGVLPDVGVDAVADDDEGDLELEEEEADWAPRRPPLSAVSRLSTSWRKTSRSVTWGRRGGKAGGGGTQMLGGEYIYSKKRKTRNRNKKRNKKHRSKTKTKNESRNENMNKRTRTKNMNKRTRTSS